MVRARICFFAVLTAVFMLCSAFRASAWELIDLQTHENWASCILSSPGEAVVRMLTEDDGTLLALDMYPDRSGKTRGSWQLKLVETVLPEDRKALDALLPRSLSGQMRVDRQATHDVLFHFSLEEDLLVIRVAGQFHSSFIKEAKKGSVVRMKMGDDSDAIYAGFSLRGFTAALNRCLELMELVDSLSPPHSDFFDEPEAPRPSSRRGGHEAYFL